DTVLVTDGTTETLISTFDRQRSNGEFISDVFKLRYDLALVTNSANARLIFRYDDAGDFNWWAGVDNIIVAGVGKGHNVVAESFNACALPQGWSTEMVSGEDDWNFGTIDTTSQAYWGGTSMDGSCFAFFDDDRLGEFAPFSTVRLNTPWFDGTQYSKYTLSLDAILRYYKEKLSVLVEEENGETHLIRESEGDVGGPQFPQYLHVDLDLSQHRYAKMRVVFEYSDGNDWGWWAGIDNVKITGEGSINDKCSAALPLLAGADCVPSDNLVAVFDGPSADCAERTEASLWYSWKSDLEGMARFQSNAQFNDVVSIYTGGCADLQPLRCDNYDEHGFIGEATYFSAQAGQEYRIRVSGNSKGFGIPRGALCPRIQYAPP
ncbi:MAG TPA: hypothetical protein PKD78_16355, partial [Saprospiraceae bacterium]|nr:hypothetical protein [Saprospiraceae bacterium]